MKVLIASRDKALTRLIQGIFESRNHVAFVAESKEEVLLTSVEGGLQIVILDTKGSWLPVGTLCSQIKSTCAGCLILAVTRDETDTDEVDRLLDAGVTDFISATVDPSSVRCRVLALERQAQSQSRGRQGAIGEGQEARPKPFHDSLTGLPGRALFLDRVGSAIARSKRRGDYSFAVLYLQFKQMQAIREELGKLTGDQLLITVARRLEACVRPGDSVARIGGDEFAILLDELEQVEDADPIADRFQQELRAPFVMEGTEIETNVSIGIAGSNTNVAGANDLLRDAELAMYRATTAPGLRDAKALVRAFGDTEAESGSGASSCYLSAAN